MMQNGHLDRAIRREMQRKGPTLPLIADQQGHVIGMQAVMVAINKPVLVALEELIRRVVREEMAKETHDQAEE